MARTNNLTNFLTDVATAIKTKKGDNTAIAASQFDTEITAIQTGKLTNEEYNTADEDLDTILEGTTPAIIYPPDWSELGYSDTPQSVLDAFIYAKSIKDNWNSNITSLSYYFSNDLNLIYMPLVDTSKVTTFNACFQGCTSLSNIPILNTQNVTNMSSAFNKCSQLESFPLLNTSKVTNMSNMVAACSKLKNIPVLDTGKVTNFLYGFQNCPMLTDESLNNIMQMCINATSFSGTKTLTNLGLSSTQKTTCQTLSNWTAFTNAGWTT